MSEPVANPLTSTEFEASYRATPPWEIGKPQAAFTDAADKLRGRVLDAGCGTGELALMAAARGLDATGIDAAPTAIKIARERATERGLSAEFVVGDVMRLAEETKPPFDTVLDSGLLHCFAGVERERYVAQVADVIAPGGLFMMLCFSDREPGSWGPYRLNHDDLLDAFAVGWRIESLTRSTFVMADLPNVAPKVEAYFVTVRRDL
jgi:SAM-dependent methyltransferase